MTTMNPAEIRRMARQLAAYGKRGDTVLAHLTPEEAAFLARNFGGDVNPVTKLPSFGFFSSITGALGLGGSGSSSSGSGAGQTAYNELSGQTAPIFSEAGTQLDQYKSGTLTPGDQASLSNAAAASKAALSQEYASAGLGTSSGLTNQINNVDFQTVQGRQNILNSYLNNAINLYGAAFGPYTQAVQDQYSGNIAAQQALSGALSGIFGNQQLMGGIGSLFGKVFGGSGVNTVAPIDSGSGVNTVAPIDSGSGGLNYVAPIDSSGGSGLSDVATVSGG